MLTRRVRVHRAGSALAGWIRALSGVRAHWPDTRSPGGCCSPGRSAITWRVLLHQPGPRSPGGSALGGYVLTGRGPCTGRGPRSPCGGHTHRPGPRSPGGSVHRAGWPGTCSPGGCCSPARSAIIRRVRVPPARPALAWRVRAHRPVTRSPGGPPGPPAGVHLVRGSRATRATRATRAGPGPGHRPGPGRCRPGGPGPTRCRPAPWAAPDTPAAPPPAAPAPGRAAAR